MIVISCTSVPAKLRGYLTNYLWEISTGVYVGSVSAKVRILLWHRVEEMVTGHGQAVIVYPSDNEQGFDFSICGTAWEPVDYEGLKLIRRPNVEMLEQKFIPKAIVRKALHGIEHRYAVLDLETTGLDVKKDHIIEIGALLVENGKTTKEFHTFVNGHVADTITELTGITQKDIDDGTDIKEAINLLHAFVSGNIVIGYNIMMFDAQILRMECNRCKVAYPFTELRDVMRIVRSVFSGLKSYKQTDVAKALGINAVDQHNALADCYTCNEIYKLCYENT